MLVCDSSFGCKTSVETAQLHAVEVLRLLLRNLLRWKLGKWILLIFNWKGLLAVNLTQLSCLFWRFIPYIHTVPSVSFPSALTFCAFLGRLSRSFCVSCISLLFPVLFSHVFRNVMSRTGRSSTWARPKAQWSGRTARCILQMAFPFASQDKCVFYSMFLTHVQWDP